MLKKIIKGAASVIANDAKNFFKLYKPDQQSYLICGRCGKLKCKCKK